MPKRTAFPAAVLFDLDGTLIDSEPIWAESTRTLARSRGATVTDDLLARISGLDATLAMRFVHSELGWSGWDIAADLAFVQDRVREAYRRGLTWRPGAAALLAATRKQGLVTGLVTSTYRPLVDLVLSAIGKDHFDVVVCGDDGHEPKPHPAPYMSAVTSLGLSASSCVAIEDSPRGVASARAAGCVVLHVAEPPAALDVQAQVRDLSEVTVESLSRLVTDRQPAARQS
jgi:HAD superfamily hydrolase (TIGR01509 family)